MVPVCCVKRNHIQSNKASSIKEDRRNDRRMTKGIASLGRTGLGSNLFYLGQAVYETSMK